MASKNKRQKSKAAQATEAARKERTTARKAANPQPMEGEIEAVKEYKGGGGLLTGMRSGFKSAVGQGEGPPKGGFMNTIVWIVVVFAFVAFVWGMAR